MTLSNFYTQLAQARQAHGDRALLLSPRLSQMPLPLQSYDDPFLPFGKAIINATRDLVCVYGFDLAAYLTIGAAGAIALERTIAYVGSDNLTLLHGLFAGAGYISVAAAFNVTAVTLADNNDAAVYQIAGFGVGHVSESFVTFLGEHKPIRLLGESALYTEHGTDFAERVRAALLA